MKSTESITLLLNEWLVVKKELTNLFEKRDKNNTLELMLRGMTIFERLLFLSNDMEVFESDLDDDIISKFKWKPVNVIERLTFIRNRPSLFHSFMQLTELINEQEKQFKKKLAIEKMTKQ